MRTFLLLFHSIAFHSQPHHHSVDISPLSDLNSSICAFVWPFCMFSSHLALTKSISSLSTSRFVGNLFLARIESTISYSSEEFPDLALLIAEVFFSDVCLIFAIYFFHLVACDFFFNHSIGFQHDCWLFMLMAILWCDQFKTAHLSQRQMSTPSI